MRLVIDIRHLTKQNPSGVGQYTLELLKALFVLDQTNEYILFSSGAKRAYQNLPDFNLPNVKKLHLNLPNRLLNLMLLTNGRPKFDELIKEKFGPAEKTLFFFPNLNIISLSPGTPYILTLHDLSFEIFPKLYNRKDRLWHYFTRAPELAQNAQTIIVPSQAAAHDVNKIFNVPTEKIVVIPHGLNENFSAKIQPQDFGIKSRYRLPKKFALFVGTLEPRKNLSAAITGLIKYRQKTKDDLRLILVGRETKYWQKIYTSLSEEEKQFIQPLGYVRDQDRPALYRLAAVTLFPSLYEGFGLPIIESMTCGTPVITSRTSSMPEVGGPAAIYINPYNSNEIAEALCELLSSEGLQKQKITAGLEQVKKYSWALAAEKTLGVLQSSDPHP
ncbi:MAG: glycosyltransferase family 1 protein [Candidatus Uhrbacteria bacterium]